MGSFFLVEAEIRTLAKAAQQIGEKFGVMQRRKISLLIFQANGGVRQLADDISLPLELL